MIPDLKAVQAQFPSCCVIIGIDIAPTTDTAAKLQTYRTSNGITWTLARDVDTDPGEGYSGLVAKLFGYNDPYPSGPFTEISAAPQTFLIDPNQMIQKHHLGSSTNVTLISEINALAPCLTPTIESCDSIGGKKDTFQLSDGVYVTGTGYSASKTFNAYLVSDVTWVEGMAIPARVQGTVTSVSSDATGKVPTKLLWSAPMVAGKYDIVIDFNGNGKYDATIDALDDKDVQVTAGLLVIPEVSFLTMLFSLLGLTVTVFLAKKGLVPHTFFH